MAYSASEGVAGLRKAFEARKSSELREVSNNCIRALALEPSAGMLKIAVISYALAKMLEKPRYWKSAKWDEFMSRVEDGFKECEACVQKGEEEAFVACMKGIEESMKQAEERDKRYVIGLLLKARIKIASTLYAQGLSLGKAAAIADVDARDVAGYAGKTMMFDRAGKTMDISERLKKLKRLFKKGQE